MSVQAKHAEIEWRRMADQETYYPLRDGPRIYRANWVIATLANYLPPDHVALAKRLSANYARIHSSRSSHEITDRVQGGDSISAQHARTHRLSQIIREFAGYEGAALMVGKRMHASLRGICQGDTQAELCRRVGFSETSKASIRKLVQLTMITMQDHADAGALDACSKLEHQLAR